MSAMMPDPTRQTGNQASAPSNLQPTPGQVAGLAPPSIQQFGATPSINPTYANVSYVDPNQNLQYMNMYGDYLRQQEAPQFAQQDQNLQDQLAARGISSSGSGQQLTNDLYGQQAGAFAGAMQPIVSQGYGYTQQDITGNQAYQNQANLANTGASNQADVLNAQYYNQDRNTNYGAYGNYLNELLGLGSGDANALQAAYLNSFGPNTGVESAYGSALNGMNSIYSNVYSNAVGGQGSALGGIGSGLGMFAGDALAAGAV